jgi:SAM-dependent methyltransferase
LIARRLLASRLLWQFKTIGFRFVRSIIRNFLHPWQSHSGLSQRRYGAYQEYLEHQKSKLSKIGNPVRKRDRLRQALRERVATMPEISRGSSVLCLAARFGGECEAFIDCGAFAIGIDINPGPDNQYVVTGDFHTIQFADASVDCIYTNSLDHVFDFNRVMSEVKRVLKGNGIFVAEIAQGSKDVIQHEGGEYESFWWDSTDTIIELIRQSGFDLIRKADYFIPRPGVHTVFRNHGHVA